MSLNEAASLHRQGRLPEAETLYRRLLAGEPGNARAHYMLAILCFQQQRLDEAVTGFDRALTLNPNSADAWNNRGAALYSLRHFTAALESYDRALALQPGDAKIWNNRAGVLRSLKDFSGAMASHDQALALAPAFADAWTNRAVTLQSLNRLAEAQTAVDKALALAPGDPAAQFAQGEILCESGRIAEGLAVFRRRAEQLYGAQVLEASGDPPPKQRHDREQRDYLAARGIALTPGLQFDGGERLAGPAVNAVHASDVTAQWQQSRPPLVVIDDLLTPPALEALRRFCLGSAVWRRPYEDGYLGATLEHGFAAPLLAQVAEELQSAFPAIFAGHGLRNLWGFKYDSRLSGIRLHADQAAVNVNFWLTPDAANRDPESGGLVVWDKAAPPDWDITRYNGDEGAARAFLAGTGAMPRRIPYRANRAVIFDSDLFHETDKIDFAEGYLNRRINITMLYGRRTADGS